jgi:hypothetical protein
MKQFGRVAMLAVVITALASVAGAATIPVGATQTYGTPVFPGGTTSATWVALSSLGLGTITPGVTLLNFFAVGAVCFNPGAGSCTTDVNVSSITDPIVGGFTASAGSTTFLSSGLGAANTIASTDWTNDFANDFWVTASGTGFVTVPNGANYLVFVFRDQYYADNVDLSPVDLGVNVTASAIPEPATYAMMLAGLGALAAFKRYRRS